MTANFGPAANEVQKFHDNDDVDSSDFAHHHTLGPSKNQAAPGNHQHSGYLTKENTRRGTTVLTGNGEDITLFTDVVFDPPFKTIPTVYASTDNNEYTTSARNVTTEGFRVSGRNMSDVLWTGELTVSWIATDF